MKTLTLKSFAKVNLYLKVLNLRKDGFHRLDTVFERISLHDTISLTARLHDQEIRVRTNSALLASEPTKNLVYKSALVLQKTFKVKQGVDIRLTKRIPLGAGLGGGSSNAATVLHGLATLWKLRLSQSRMQRFARSLGSDVAFFTYGTSFAQAGGRGDIIKPIELIENVKLWHLLVKPAFPVSTPRIYAAWDLKNNARKIEKAGLTRPASNVKLLSLALQHHDLGLLKRCLHNDLEQVTLKLYPEIIRIKHALLQIGLKAVLMSGSGPTVFGLVDSKKKALAAKAHLKKQHPQWQVFIACTV